jgi:hypothetical protein
MEISNHKCLVIGAIVKKYRKKAKLSKGQLAIEVWPTSGPGRVLCKRISKIERGAYPLSKLEVLRLMKILEIENREMNSALNSDQFLDFHPLLFDQFPSLVLLCNLLSTFITSKPPQLLEMAIDTLRSQASALERELNKEES